MGSKSKRPRRTVARVVRKSVKRGVSKTPKRRKPAPPAPVKRRRRKPAPPPAPTPKKRRRRKPAPPPAPKRKRRKPAPPPAPTPKKRRRRKAPPPPPKKRKAPKRRQPPPPKKRKAPKRRQPPPPKKRKAPKRRQPPPPREPAPRPRPRSKKSLRHFDGRIWRDGYGHPIKRPLESKLRHDSAGHPLDDRGRRVSLFVTREPARPPPVAVRDVPVNRIGLSDVMWKTADHVSIEKDRYKNFSHMNRQAPDEINKVFEAAIAGHVKKGGFEPDEVTLYDYGILLRPPHGHVPEGLLTAVRTELAGTGSSVTIVQEGPYQDAMLIHFGDSRVAMDIESVGRSLEAFKAKMGKVYESFIEWLGDDPDWSVWWDTDEETY